MKLNRITWTKFFIFSLISMAIWIKFSYPQLAMTNILIDRKQAVEISKNYLKEKGTVDVESFQTATVFRMDSGANRYLQKTVGFEGLKAFIQEHDFNIFFWVIRFFKENEKEEYFFTVEAAKGEIIGYRRIIDENAARKEVSKDEAREKTKEFLVERFGLDPDGHMLRSDLATVRDNRSDYLFSWQKNSVNIPWSDQADSGTGKLITGATISGDEILTFSKHNFIVPDQFHRDLSSRRDLSANIMIGIKICTLLLFVSGIFFIIVRQNHLAMHCTKRFYIGIMLISFTLSLMSNFNQFQQILFHYSTTLSFNAYLWRFGINAILSALFITVAILIPSLAGELLHYETSSKRREGSFLHYIQSTFLSCNVAQLIVLGYFVCFIMLGIQSVLIQIGQTYFGVWVEHNWMTSSSNAYLPFLATFTFGYKTSLSEEIMYRFYAINLGKKIFNKILPKTNTMNIILVCLLSSLIWGFAHSGYSIFPMWYRGLEVTCIGIFLAFIYLKFGLIPVIIGHYLFDVFWDCAGFIFGVSKPLYFYGSLFVLFLPLGIGIVTFLINRKENIRPLRWHLSKHQLYNLEVLKAYLCANMNTYKNKTQEQIKEEITPHGWDPAVVDVASKDFLKDVK